MDNVVNSILIYIEEKRFDTFTTKMYQETKIYQEGKNGDKNSKINMTEIKT